MAARRLSRRALLLDRPVASVSEALAHHGYIQIDPINVCGRMQDLILRNRVADYREGDLLRYVHQPSRPGFEHYLPDAGILCAFPINAWPHLVPAMRARSVTSGRYSGALSATEEQLALWILDQIGERGALMSDEIKHSGTALTAWGSTGREVKTVLEKLFFHGRVLISSRRNFRRVYDLPERVLPREVLRQPLPSPQENQRWRTLVRLRQRRMAKLRKQDVALVEDHVQPVKIEDASPVYMLQEDLPLLEETLAGDPPGRGATSAYLLAPLDPLIYDRRLTSDLWDYQYTWEVYTPPEKRVRGYYALPILVGTEIIGHIDLKANRKSRRLETISRQTRGRVALSGAVANLTRFLGLKI